MSQSARRVAPSASRPIGMARLLFGAVIIVAGIATILAIANSGLGTSSSQRLRWPNVVAEGLSNGLHFSRSRVDVIAQRIETLGSELVALQHQAHEVAKTLGNATNTRSPVVRKRRTPHSPAKPPPSDVVNTIFVSVASYRDPECAPTIASMFEKAKFPRALFIGAVEQHMDQDVPCMPASFLTPECQAMEFCPADNVAVRRVQPRDAKGPTFGRYVGMLLYRGEDFYMMIDSHNRFVTHWDHIAVEMLKRAPSQKAVLSHYPEAWHNPEDKQSTNAPLDNRATTTFLCAAKFVDQGYVRLDGFVVHKVNVPRLQPWAAAGFLFANASLIKEVPFDPHLNYVFDGEEILYSVRMWTHGWDIYSPSENLLYHYYYRTKAIRFWSLLPNNWISVREVAHRRIQHLLKVRKVNSTELLVPDAKEQGVGIDLDKYGLGKARTVEQWYDFAGVDPVKRVVAGKWCSKA